MVVTGTCWRTPAEAQASLVLPAHDSTQLVICNNIAPAQSAVHCIVRSLFVLFLSPWRLDLRQNSEIMTISSN